MLGSVRRDEWLVLPAVVDRRAVLTRMYAERPTTLVCLAVVNRLEVRPLALTSQAVDVALVEPNLIAEVAVDGALDSAGRWRHPVKWLRLRMDLTPSNVPLFGSGNDPAAS